MSHKCFSNKDCQYFPCHNIEDEFNCLFCYCPLYLLENCGGKPIYIDNNIKDCSNCTIVHSGTKGFDFVNNQLKNKIFNKQK